MHMRLHVHQTDFFRTDYQFLRGRLLSVGFFLLLPRLCSLPNCVFDQIACFWIRHFQPLLFWQNDLLWAPLSLLFLTQLLVQALLNWFNPECLFFFFFFLTVLLVCVKLPVTKPSCLPNVYFGSLASDQLALTNSFGSKYSWPLNNTTAGTPTL